MSQALTEAETDRRLIEAVQSGDRAALARLYDRHAPAMLGSALRILGGRAEAEDLVHDVFIEAWKRADAHDARRGSVRAWLLMRVRSRGIDRLRALDTARRHGLTQREEAPLVSPPPGPDVEADHRRASRALALLGDAQRVVLEAAYFEGLTHREIAERLGIPIGTVKSRLSAALARLQGALVDGGGDRR